MKKELYVTEMNTKLMAIVDEFVPKMGGDFTAMQMVGFCMEFMYTCANEEAMIDQALDVIKSEAKIKAKENRELMGV